MIFWIASYPKSGNTWLRTLLSAYYYSDNGIYLDHLIKNIGQFPEKRHFEGFNYDQKIITDTTRFWIKAQSKINQDKKLRFFKTHNILGKINNQNFTNKENTIGAIYIVRDPRNVITSLKNHYELNDEQALKWMTNEKQFIYDTQNFERDAFSDFQFISSWDKNYYSWKSQKVFPVKFVKYEDLLEKTYSEFYEIVEFVNKTLNNNQKINKVKLKNAVNSTSFSKLKKNEIKYGFSEAITSKNKNQKIPFFYLGPENNWRKILNKNIRERITDVFEKNLKELCYD